MIVQVLKPAYLSNHRKAAFDAWDLAVRLELAKAKEAMILKKCDLDCLCGKSPTDSNQYVIWERSLNACSTEHSALKAAYEKLQMAYDNREHMSGVPFANFLHKFDQEHYHPAETDYDNIEVPDRHGRSGLLKATETVLPTVEGEEVGV